MGTHGDRRNECAELDGVLACDTSNAAQRRAHEGPHRSFL